MSFGATYFDGTDLHGQPADVAVQEDGGLAIRLGETTIVISPRDYSVSVPLARVPFYIALPGDCWLDAPWTADSEAQLQATGANWRPANTVVRWLEANTQMAAAAVVVLGILIAGAFWKGIPYLSERIASKVPAVIEVQIGRGSLGTLSKFAAKSEVSLADRRHIADLLVALTKVRTFHVKPEIYVVRMGQPNAFALPGGPIIVTDELIQLHLSDDQLSAILAHELGHLELRHGLRQILTGSTALIVVSAITGDLSALTHFSGTLPILLLSRGYSRDFERQADSYAVDLLAQAHINPNSLATALKRLEGASPVKSQQSSYLSTHPSTPERIARIKAQSDIVAPEFKNLGEPSQPGVDEAMLDVAEKQSDLFVKAIAASRSKDFAGSVVLFRRGFDLRTAEPNYYYLAARSAARTNDPSDAYDWLEKACKSGLFPMKTLSEEKDFSSFKDTPRWRNFIAAETVAEQARAKRIDKNFQTRLLKIIDSFNKRETQELKGIDMLHGGEKSAPVPGYPLQANFDALEALVSTDGWPSQDRVGARANSALYFALMDCDPGIRQQFIVLARTAVLEKTELPQSLAAFEDQSAIREGKNQIYGTVALRDPDSGIPQLSPLTEPEKVDRRRAEIGLDPLAAYLSANGVPWHRPGVTQSPATPRTRAKDDPSAQEPGAK